MTKKLKPCPFCGGYPPVSFVSNASFEDLVRRVHRSFEELTTQYGNTQPQAQDNTTKRTAIARPTDDRLAVS